MSLMITGGGAPASLAVSDSEHDDPHGKRSGTPPVSPSISVSPFDNVNISPSDGGGVKVSHDFFNLHLGPTWSKDILGTSGEAHAGADVSGSGYVSVSPKDNVCVGLDLGESVGAGVAGTATAGRVSGTIAKGTDKDIRSAHVQVCTGPAAGHALVAAADGIATGIKNGLRAAVESVPAIMTFQNRFRSTLSEVLNGVAAPAGAAAGGSVIARFLGPLLDSF